MNKWKKGLCLTLCALLTAVQLPWAHAAKYYDITAKADKGASVESIDPDEVEAGEDSEIIFELEPGYVFDHVIVEDRKEDLEYKIDDPQGEMVLSEDAQCEIDADDQTVMVWLENIETDYRVYLYTAEQDEQDSEDSENVHIVTSGDSHVSVDSDSGSSAKLGDTINFYITPDAGYEVDQITLTINGKSDTASLEERTLRVDGRTYYIADKDDGSRVLIVRNVGNNVKVKAESSKIRQVSTGGTGGWSGVTNPSYYTVSAYGDVGVSVTTNTTTVLSGGSANVQIIPKTGYEIQNITLKVGTVGKTVAPQSGTLSVGNVNGTLTVRGAEATLALSNINNFVTVSATSKSVSGGTTTQTNPSTQTPVTPTQPVTQTVTISTSADSGCTVTSDSGSTAMVGSTVTFRVTPRSGYQLGQLTLKVGDIAESVSADSTAITVNGVSYPIRTESGATVVTVSNVKSNLMLSASSNAQSGPYLNRSNPIAFLSGNGDGTITPEAPMTRAEAAVMLERLMAGESDFVSTYTDVPVSAWYAQAVGRLELAGVFEVEANGAFRPDDKITRAELVHWFTMALGGKTSIPCQYTDVNADTPYYKSIAYGSAQGWINGYSDGSFRPSASITRSEAACMALRVMGWQPNRTAIDQKGQMFSDMPKTYWGYYELSAASAGLYL